MINLLDQIDPVAKNLEPILTSFGFNLDFWVLDPTFSKDIDNETITARFVPTDNLLYIWSNPADARTNTKSIFYGETPSPSQLLEILSKGI